MAPSDKARDLILEAFRNAERFPPLGECSDRPAGNSQHSQAINAPFQLSDAEIDAFEERAAILEHDAGIQRWDAEVKALMSVLARRHCS